MDSSLMWVSLEPCRSILGSLPIYSLNFRYSSSSFLYRSSIALNLSSCSRFWDSEMTWSSSSSCTFLLNSSSSCIWRMMVSLASRDCLSSKDCYSAFFISSYFICFFAYSTALENNYYDYFCCCSFDSSIALMAAWSSSSLFLSIFSSVWLLPTWWSYFSVLASFSARPLSSSYRFVSIILEVTVRS